MAKSDSSRRWLHEHFNDEYVKRAKADGWRSRAVYKLIEINEKDKLIRNNMRIIDLGAAPGSWSEYIVKQNFNGYNLALDILDMDKIQGVNFIKGDFREKKILDLIILDLKNEPVDLIVSDMAPNMSGHAVTDMVRAMYLCELAVELADETLKSSGILLMKVFHGAGFEELIKDLRSKYVQVIIRKPGASRDRSKEQYVLCKNKKSKPVLGS